MKVRGPSEPLDKISVYLQFSFRKTNASERVHVFLASQPFFATPWSVKHNLRNRNVSKLGVCRCQENYKGRQHMQMHRGKDKKICEKRKSSLFCLCIKREHSVAFAFLRGLMLELLYLRLCLCTVCWKCRYVEVSRLSSYHEFCFYFRKFQVVGDWRVNCFVRLLLNNVQWCVDACPCLTLCRSFLIVPPNAPMCSLYPVIWNYCNVCSRGWM